MKTYHSITTLLLAICFPFITSAQRHGHGGGGPPPGIPVGDSTTPPIIVPTTAPTVIVNTIQNTAQNTIQNTVVDTQMTQGGGGGGGGGGVGGATSTAAGPVSTGGGDIAGGVSCSAVAGNMNVQLSGANVAFRLEPPVAGIPTTGMTGDCSVWSFPKGWNGRVHVGGGDGAPFGSTLYEGNFNATTGLAAMDVSFVEGFSVPMLCTDTSNNFVSGCGIDLFAEGTCPTGGSAGGVCTNPQGPGGTRDSKDNACEACSAPDPFFGLCSAAGFTFPTDDDANDGVSGLEIKCAIGPSEVRTGREGNTATTGHPEAGRCSVCAGPTKRDLEEVLFGKRARSPVAARSPSMLPRVHKKSVIDVLGRRSHRHGMLAHDGKVR
ncbi:MAG: hypothetical protein Q9170_007709 [Blastenia crenularia]